MERNQRYERAMHAMQTGVLMEMELGSKDTTPKHLRVGVNSALCDQSSLAHLLIRKGVITEDEYVEAVIAGIEDEVRRYEDRLSKMLGKKVVLG